MQGVTVAKINPMFEDDRGKIFDLFEEPVHHVGLITFTEGAVRAKHYHKQSTQYSYVLDGVIELIVCPKDRLDDRETIELSQGMVASIEPGIVHVYRAKTNASIWTSRRFHGQITDMRMMSCESRWTYEGVFFCARSRSESRMGKSAHKHEPRTPTSRGCSFVLS
ncbi:MAG: cupin domain-containing protein [Patescibacteria group bacterium]